MLASEVRVPDQSSKLNRFKSSLLCLHFRNFSRAAGEGYCRNSHEDASKCLKVDKSLRSFFDESQVEILAEHVDVPVVIEVYMGIGRQRDSPACRGDGDDMYLGPGECPCGSEGASNEVGLP
ncbi:unnamed protein product [Haemonchus placei]|uniref:C3H1-type domain-containing protein n=1 Tax=Haemonchus placei TaxID=6290 RepID=A0A0N4X0G6_HAEPC|nr:unnamed protein product [Haemonchus placei]